LVDKNFQQRPQNIRHTYT